jgi:CrcB protein
MTWILMAALGGLGVLIRYGLSAKLNSEAFPYGILVANVLGSFAMGWCFFSPAFSQMAPMIRGAVLIGFLGALTTFSSFSMDIINMLERGQLGLAAGYFMSTNALALTACWLGVRLAKAV